MGSYRINRKNAIPLGTAIQEYLESSRLSTGMNTRRIFAAWDAVSGAGPFTIKRYYRSGKLYITLQSSVVCSQLYPRRGELTDKINEFLSRDEFFCPDNKTVSWVEEIILK